MIGFRHKREGAARNRMPDGTVYAGSLDSKDIYTTREDAPLTHTFNEASEYAAKLNRDKYLGHADWRVPTKGELNVLFQNRAAIGEFDESGSDPAGWYWSSSQYVDYNAWAQRFSDGNQNYGDVIGEASLRCVRG
jgi:hypothetical protein